MMAQTLEILKVFSVVGIPSLFAILSAIGHLIRRQEKKIQTLMAAQQAQMRRDLMHDYYHHMAKGSISARDMDDWEAQYQAYHNLGANGVLDARRDELLRLPSKEKTEAEG